MNFIKSSLLLACLFVGACSKREVAKTGGEQVSSKPVEYQLLTDDRFLSRPIKFPTGEVTDEQRESFAKELESAIDSAKANFEVIAVRAEAPGKAVISLSARGVTRPECESLVQSPVIQRATEIGFRTLSCADRANRVYFSTPIKGSRGEVRITEDEQGELQVIPVR